MIFLIMDSDADVEIRDTTKTENKRACIKQFQQHQQQVFQHHLIYLLRTRKKNMIMTLQTFDTFYCMLIFNV